MKSIDKKQIKASALILVYVLFLLVSCRKFAEVDPPVSRTTGESVYKEDLTAIAVLTGLYTSLSQTNSNSKFGLSTVLSKRTGLSADELSLWNGAGPNDMAYYMNSLSAGQGTTGSAFIAGHETWTTCYSYIYICNSAIEGLSSSTTLTPLIKQQLLGEARLMRAFFYFYLVNLYGDVPLLESSDYKINRLLGNTTKSEIYNLIVSDLTLAQDLLSPTYLNGQLKSYSGNPERVRPTKWLATALLARVYLYMGDYKSAEQQATSVISNSTLYTLSSLEKVFQKASLGNNEPIWQLQPVNTNGSQFWNTEDARLFKLNQSPVGLNSDHPVYISPSLLSSFENGDNRLNTWIGHYVNASESYYFPNKYKVATPSSTISEYLMVVRLAELFLIRSEARAQQDNFAGALVDLNAIRSRAGLPSITITDKSTLLSVILHERQVELFTEWGHRWLDLKRTRKIDVVMNVQTPLKTNGKPWQSYQQFYPIPLSDILANPNLNQNADY